MTVTVCLLATELINLDSVASVNTALWWCRICDRHGTATTRPAAHTDGVEHLTAEHHATISGAPKVPAGRRLSGAAPIMLPGSRLPAVGRFQCDQGKFKRI